MSRSRRSSLTVELLLVATVAALAAAWAAPAAHAAAATGHFAPRSPAFLAYQHRLEATGAHPMSEPLVPAPVNTRPWAKAVLPLGPLALGSSYDPAYDLRTLNRLTPVRDQGSLNICWVFASLASLESSLMPADPEDFSEDNLAIAAANDFDAGLYQPGNFYMSTAELARWNGPVDQSVEPYGKDQFVSGQPPLVHVQNVLFLPDRTSWSDNDTIKWAIVNYGAVYTGMYADDSMYMATTPSYFNAATDAYYYNGSQQADHAVDIVGWDDNYDPSNFASDVQPADKGAFIVRNSWGSGWGDAGYFYVSYDDVQIGKNMAVFTGDSVNNYAQNLGYDKLGFTDEYGYRDQFNNPLSTAWMAAAFTPKGDNPVEAASFYAQTPNTAYEIYVGSDLDDTSTWTELADDTIAVPGYHTIPFATQPIEPAGVRFYLIVELTTPGYDYPIPLEDAVSGYSMNATSAPGESFVSSDGSSNSWTDIGAQGADVCLNVFTGTPTPDLIRPVTRALAAVKVVRGRYATLRYRVNDTTPNDSEKVTIKIRNRVGKVVKTLSLGWRSPNVSLSTSYRCTLARGSYHYYVYATDRWGNAQTSAGHAALTVK